MEDTFCLICRDESSDFLTRCNHHFHLDCLHYWFTKQKNEECPLCRGPLSNIQLVEDFVSKRITVKTLFKINTPSNIDRSFVDWIVRGGDIEAMAALVKNKVNLLEEATRHNRLDILAFLLKSSQGKEKTEQLKVIRFMSKKKIKHTSETIYLASTAGRLDIIKHLLETTEQPCTPLAVQLAVQAGHLHIIKYLVKTAHIQYPANIVDVAVRNGKHKVVKYLLDEKNTCTSDSVTHAAVMGNLKEIKILMDHKCPCTADAIHFATFKGHLEIVKYLLKNGAPCHNNAREFASEQGQSAIADLLSEHMKI